MATYDLSDRAHVAEAVNTACGDLVEATALGVQGSDWLLTAIRASRKTDTSLSPA